MAARNSVNEVLPGCTPVPSALGIGSRGSGNDMCLTIYDGGDGGDVAARSGARPCTRVRRHGPGRRGYWPPFCT